ncbi:hypothetical protein OF83DRAFT_1069550 [Amylostereum chailletii]|nr:hypothetical protein OF83DRAFT_1069550 [Amylostereum chailletii]
MPVPTSKAAASQVQWNWALEHEDRKREAKADVAVHGTQPFLVDRRLLKDVVKEKLSCEVGRIHFLSSGTFHKAYLVTLYDGREVIVRVARRFMPRIKTESEIATMDYIRAYTSIPVPIVYHYDANPYNRLGGEYMIMSKAKGVPLSSVYHDMSHHDLTGFLDNLASLVIPLFAHRFPSIGSLYAGKAAAIEDPQPTSAFAPSILTPTLPPTNFAALTPTSTGISSAPTPRSISSYFTRAAPEFRVGPIVSWPFFGSNRGDLMHPAEIDRGPWTTTEAYMRACALREEQGVLRENEGKAAPHRLHLDPDEIRASRHHHINALPDDKSDDSDEWDREESEGEWDGPGDTMYRDYRRMQRSTFLVAHLGQREGQVKTEMARWMRIMFSLGATPADPGHPEEFGMDCHDLSLENIFVDPENPSKITCIIDWESTTIRPLWQCAHLPAFLQSSPFVARLFRNAVTRLARSATHEILPKTTMMRAPPTNITALAAEWLHFEAAGAYLRQAHRCVEWDGWEEGLVEALVGPEDQEEEWLREAKTETERALKAEKERVQHGFASLTATAIIAPRTIGSDEDDDDSSPSVDDILKPLGVKRRRRRAPLHATAEEKAREKELSAAGDVGHGGELGRRLEALLTLHGNGDGSVKHGKRWASAHDSDEEYEGGAE